MPTFEYITYETLQGGAVARIMLNRPTTRNAQNRGLLIELGEAFELAEGDDDVRVVILGGYGPTFSSGHDLGSSQDVAERTGENPHPTYLNNGGGRVGVEHDILQEWHHFFRNTRRWRDLRKITIAQVQGSVYSAALMLMWCCDLIVAADDARFADVVATRLGMCGVEYFAHPWEFGARKAKELLLTGDAIDAHEAYRLGMVSKVFPTAELAEHTLAFASRIAAVPTVTALLVKESVNQTQDAMGFSNALNTCFQIHQLNAAHWTVLNGERTAALPRDGVPDWREAPPVVLAARSSARGDV